MGNRYMLDQADQVLNLKDNYYNHQGMNSRLYGVYAYVLENQTNNEFKESLIKSEELCKELTFEDSIKKLKNNNPDSFFIVTIHTEGHCMASVIRKIDNIYSLTLVNAGDKKEPRDRVTEYLFKNENYEKLITCMNLGNIEGVGPVLCYYSKPNKQQLVNEYLKFCDDSCRLNVYMGEQKIGNCMVKEPEKAIKYAFATRNFNAENFDTLRVKDLKEYNKNRLKPKWKPSTLEVHRLYIERLKIEYPQFEKNLDKKFSIYAKNKGEIILNSERDTNFLAKLSFWCGKKSVDLKCGEPSK